MPNTPAMGTWAHDPAYMAILFSAVITIRVVSHLLGSRRDAQGQDGADDASQKHDGVKRWPIGRLPHGAVGRVVGTVRTHERVLRAPLSGRPCVYYEVIVEAITTTGLRLCFTDCDAVPFALEDDSGRAIIDPWGSEVSAAFDHTEELSEYGVATPEQAALFTRHDRAGEHAGAMLFREALLVEGERVTVVGTAQRAPDLRSRVEVDYRAAPPLQLRIVTTDAVPLSIASHYVS